MHEYSIVQALYEKVAAHAAAQRATGVHEVIVRIGELSGVDAELLATAWTTFNVRTMCEATPLRIARTPGDDIVLERIVMEVGHV